MISQQHIDWLSFLLLLFLCLWLKTRMCSRRSTILLLINDLANAIEESDETRCISVPMKLVFFFILLVVDLISFTSLIYS